MFLKEQQLIEEKIKEFCTANNITLAELKWTPIPFSGEWGMSTSFFQTAANEARAGKGNKVPVPQKAQEIAEQVKGAVLSESKDQPEAKVPVIAVSWGFQRRDFLAGHDPTYIVDSPGEILDIVMA